LPERRVVQIRGFVFHPVGGAGLDAVPKGLKFRAYLNVFFEAVCLFILVFADMAFDLVCG